MTTDPYKGITIQYNFLNLPRLVTKGAANITIRYDASGRKWSQTGTEGIREYVGGIEYLDQKIQSVQHGEGRLVAAYNAGGTAIESIRAEYWRQDHLGNTRVAFSDFNLDGVIATKDDPNTTGNDIEITQENHYYPFGLNHEGPWYQTVQPKNKYQYNGKEYVEDLGLNWNDYGARWYDPSIAKWGQIDPRTEDFFPFSPYNFTFNNPLKFIDLDGRAATITIDMEASTVTISADLRFYGPAATTERARAIASAIQSDWNAAGASISVNGTAFNVNFLVTGTVVSDATGIAGKKLGGDSGENFIRLDEDEAVSEIDELGGHSGRMRWHERGIEDKEYSHEFGHLLGWFDPQQMHRSFGGLGKNNTAGDHDFRGYSDPNYPDGNATGIMTPGNTARTDPRNYTIRSANARNFSTAFFPNGTIDLSMRRVTQADINRIGVNISALGTGEGGVISTKELRNNPRYSNYFSIGKK